MLFLSLLPFIAALPAPETPTYSTTPHPPAPTSSLLSNTTYAAIQNFLALVEAPGTVVAITKKDQTEVLTFGVQDNKNTTLSPDTFFPIASNSKHITSLAMALLIHENTTVPNTGKPLTYDTLMTDIVSDFAFNNTNITETVTLFDVMAMRTGLPGHVLGILNEQSVDDFRYRLRYLSTNAQPGEIFQYSNPGYIVLSSLFPVLVGKTVEEFVQERFFNPLNMTATYDAFVARERGVLNQAFLRQDLNITKCTESFAAGSLEGCGTQESIPFWSEGSGHEWSGSGSAIFSGHDLAKWAKELVNPKVIPPIVINATEFAFPLSVNETNSTDAVGRTYQLGTLQQNYRGFINTFHDGALPGSNSWFARIPDQDVGVFVVSNEDRLSVITNEIVSNMVLDDLLGLEPIDWVTRNLGDLSGSTSTSDPAAGGAGAAVPVLPPTNPRPEPTGYVSQTYSHGAYGEFTLLPLDFTDQENFEQTGIPRDFVLTDVASQTAFDFSGPVYYAKTNLILMTHLIFTHWDGPLYNMTGIMSRQRATGGLEIQATPQWGSQYVGKLYQVAPVVFGDNGIGIFGDFTLPSIPGPQAVETGVKETAVVFFDRV